jgi:hypothetical protein
MRSGIRRQQRRQIGTHKRLTKSLFEKRNSKKETTESNKGGQGKPPPQAWTAA